MRDVAAATIDALETGSRFPAAAREQCFDRRREKSIDFAVMEKTSRAAVLPVDFGWSDIGSWGALWDELDRDKAGKLPSKAPLFCSIRATASSARTKRS